MANPWEEFQDDDADVATGTLIPEAIGPWSDFAEPEEDDSKPWEAFKEPDPIGDYNSAASIAEKFARSREENYAKYNELAQIPERTPEIVQQMVEAFNAGKQAEIGLYGEQDRLNTLRPEVDRIQAQRAEERRNQIESKRLDPAFGDSVADQLYQFDEQMAAEMEQARSIADIEERNSVFESIAKKYADQENSLIKSSAEGYANRFDAARETAWLLRQLEVNNKRAWADYGAAVAEGYGEIPFDMPDRPEGLKVAEEAWQGVKDTQNKNRAETEEAINKLVSAFPTDQQEQIRRDAEEWISVQKGEKEVAIVQGRPVFSKDVQGDYDRAKELVEDLFTEGEINDIQRSASIEALDATAAAEREDKLRFIRELPDYAQRAEGKTDDEVLEEYEASRTGFVSSVMDYFSGASEGFGGYIDMAVDGQRLRDTLDSGDEDQARELAFELIQKTIDKQRQNADPFRDPTAAMAGQVLGQVGAQITSQKGGEIGLRGLFLAVSALLKSPTINQLGQQAAPWVAGAASAVANANIYGLDWFQTTVQDFLEAANVRNINDLSDDQKKQLYKEATDAFYASQLPSVTELVEPTMFLNLPKAARKSMIGRTIDGGINIGVEVGQEKFTEEWKEAYMRNAVSAHQAQSTMGADDMKAMALGLLPLGGAKFAVDTVRARREAVTERRLQDLEKADAARAEQLRAEQAAISAAEEAANNAATVTPESADAMKQAVEATKTDVETKITDGLREGLVRLPEDFIAQRNQTVNQALERIRANDDSNILRDMIDIAVDEVVRPAEGLNPVTVRGLKDDVTYLENLINKNQFKVSEIDKTRFKTFMAPENYERFVQVVESNPQEVISSLRGLVDDYVARGEVPVEGAGAGEEEEARILPTVRTIADSIRDKDTFVYEGMRGALIDEDGEVVFRPFGTQERYAVAVNPNQTLSEIEGIQWARRGQRRIRPEEERTETTTIVEQGPTVTTEEADIIEDAVETPQALIEIERSPTLNFFADLFDTGESKVSQEGKRARKVSETPEFYRQVRPEQIEQANRLVDSALRIIDAMPISEDQKAELSEPFLLLDQDISTYESNPEYQRYKSSIVREVRPAVEAGAVSETEAEVAAGVTELEQRAAAEVARLEQEAQARRVAAGQAAFVAARPTEAIIRVARAEATPQEFEALVEQGLAEEYKGQQVITQAGIDALPENERPRLTPQARRIQIDTGASEVVSEAISKGLRFGVDQVPPTFRMPQGWTMDGDIYVPPPRTAPEEVARIAEQYGVDEATATAIFNNEIFEVPMDMLKSERPAPAGFFFEGYDGKTYGIPVSVIKKRLAAQSELSKLSILERAALSGMLTEQRLLNSNDAKRYIQEASSRGFTADEIAAATTAAQANWNERFPDNGNAREVAGDVSPPIADFAAEETASAGAPLASDRIPSSKLFDLTAREALRYIAGLNLGAQIKTAEGRILTETQILRRAASVLAKLPLRILDADFIKRARGGDRAYRANEGFIRVPATSGGQEFLVSIRTIIHEVAHTLTADAFRKYVADRSRHVRGKDYLNALDKALASPDTPDQVKRAINLYKQTLDELGLANEYFRDGGLADLDPTYSMNKAVARKIPLINKFTGKAFTSNEFYALANLDEFFAQTWSSTEFQDLLKNIKVKNQPSIYERFVRLVRDLFGFESDTMAAAVIDATNSLAELEAPARGATVQERIDANLRAGMDVTTPAMPPTIQPTAPPEARRETAITTQQDADYLAAVEGGDSGTDNLSVLLRASKAEDRPSVYQRWAERNPKAAESLQRVIDAAAKAAGFRFGPVFHGTKELFNIFRSDKYEDRLIYFSEREQFSREWARGRKPRQEVLDRINKVRAESKEYVDGLFEAEPSLTNNERDLAIAAKHFEKQKEFERQRLDGMTVSEAQRDAGIRLVRAYLSADNIFDPAKNWREFLPEILTRLGITSESEIEPSVMKGIQDGNYLIWEDKNVMDAVLSKYDAIRIQETSGGPADTIAVRNPEQIKLADPVTYDDQGNIIPLSQRFQPEEADIRYARRDVASIQQQYAPKTDEEQQSFDRASTNKILARNPQLAVAAVRLKNGEITAGEYADLVDILDPFVVKGAEPVPTNEKIYQYMSQTAGGKPTSEQGKKKLAKIGAFKEDGTQRIPNGKLAEFRIDIPTYNESTKNGDTVYSITGHEPVSETATSVGETIAHLGIAKITNPQFITRTISGKGDAIQIAMGAGKFPLATVKGNYEAITELPADINDPNVWTETGYNPVRSSELVDVRSKKALVGGTEAIMVGSRVFVKNAQLEARPTGITMGERYGRRVQMGRAGMEQSAVEARLQELGFPAGGILRVVNEPDADFEGRTIIVDGKVTGIELNAAAMRDNATIDRVLNHEFAESANADGALNRLVQNLTPKEKKEINDTITRLRYEEMARTSEEAARAIETLAEAWKGRGFFTRAVARIEAWANKLGFKLTRRAAEYIAARNLAEVNDNVRKWHIGEAMANIKGARKVSFNGLQAILIPPSEMRVAYSIAAYHGTPHRIKGGFQLKYVGTGEGAAAFGWGLYFAENKEVAKQYREQLSGYNEPVILSRSGKRFGGEWSKTEERAFVRLQQGESDAGQFQYNTVYYAKKRAQDAGETDVVALLDSLGSDARASYEQNRGNLYSVTLDVESEELLDWGKPLGEQSDKVRGALASLGIREMIPPTFSIETSEDGTYSVVNDATGEIVASNLPYEVEARVAISRELNEYGDTGEYIYQKIAGDRGGVQDASRKLLAAGVKGIRYLDQGSRPNPAWPIALEAAKKNLISTQASTSPNKKQQIAELKETIADLELKISSEGTYNFVIFDENLIKITGVNGQPVDIRESRREPEAIPTFTEGTPDPDINEAATTQEVTQAVTNRAEAKKAQEAVTGHSILPDEIPTELNEEAQARYENGMALGDFLNPEFFNLGEAYKPHISAIWLNLNGGLMPTVKVEGKEIAKPEKGTTQAETLRLLKRATDILDARSETTGGKDLTYSLQDIMATWMDSGLGQAALKNAIVQYTNLDVAQADKTAADFARVYELAQNVTNAKERAQVRMERALPAVTNRQQREKERMIKLEEAAGTIDSIAEAIRVAFDVNIKKPKTDRATEKKQIEEQLRVAKRIIREVVPRQYLGDQLLTLERATGLEGLKKVVEAAQNGLNEARLDGAVASARKAYDRAKKAVKANEISPEAMAVLRDFVETYSKKGIGPETRAKIEEAMKRYEADPVGALEDLAVQKYLKQKGDLAAIKIDKSLGLDALREIAAMVNSTLHADKVARGEMLFNKQQTRMELVDDIAAEIDQVKSIAKARKDGGMGIGLFNKVALYKGARVENILRAFGLNKLREFVYDRLTLDAYNDELRVRRDLKKKIEARVKEITGLEIGTRDYDLWSKEMIELTGVDGSGVSKPIKIQRREFLDMVASLRDESNFRRAVNSGGYVIDRLDTAAVDTVKITPDTYFEILNKMTDQDTQMVDMMVDLYNNDLFTILENASLQAYGHGIKGVTGTYYPRTADKWTRTTETKKDMDYIAYYQRRVDDVGYLKERDEKAKSKLRAVDFLQRLDYHVTNDARIGAYLPIVRDIEMVLNDPKIARPLAQKIGEDGLKMIKEMVRQQTTPPAGLPMGLLSTLVGNAGVGVLGFKLHAAMQNPVGIPIALAYYGKDGFKYLAKAFPYGLKAMNPKDRRDMAAVLSKYSPYYNERYGDGGFIQEFTSGLSNAPSDTKWRKNLETAAMSWLEGTDRWGALVRYKIAQQVVRDRTALQEGTDEFNQAVAREWNRMMFRSENTAHGADRTGVFQFAGQHPVFKVFIMFQSAVSKQYSLFVEAMLQAQQGGRQNLQDAATKLAFLSISLAASKAISQAFYSLLFPPEDEEEKEKTWAQLLGKVAGTPLSIVPVVGPTLQNFTESFFSPDQMRKPMQIDLISSFIFGIGDTLALTRRAFDQLTDEQIDEATGNAKFWETSYRALKKALAVGGIPTGVPAAGVVQTGELGFRLVENLRNVFNDEPKTEDFQKKVREYEKSLKAEPVRQEMAKLYFAVTENDQKAFNRAYRDILKKRPDIKRSDLINSIRRRQDFRVVGMVRSGKLKQKDLEANGISRDYFLEQKALLRSVEKAAATMWRDAKDGQ